METPDHTLTTAPGTYALALTLITSTPCTVGALGAFTFPSGTYLYVGSAWGPGGLAARVGRHLRGSPKHRWHIDYLRQIATPTTLWLAPRAHNECAWAQYLLAQSQAQVIAHGFGASDCACNTHLAYFADADVSTLVLPDGIRAISVGSS